MVIAKTEKRRKPGKTVFRSYCPRQYFALVWGDVENDAGTIRAHVGRHQAISENYLMHILR